MKATTDRMVMPADVKMASAGDFDPARLAGLEFAEDDWIVMRPASRSRSMIISADLAELFRGFRTPCTILDAVLQYAMTRGLDPQAVLNESWPVLTRFLHANWLVPENSYLSRELAPWYEPGTSLMHHTVEACIHVTDDTQVYRVRAPTGETRAIKVVDTSSGPSVAALHQEARILRQLGGSPAPRFLGLGGDQQRLFMTMEWCEGIEVTQAAARATGGSDSREATRDLLVAVLSAYRTLHAHQVIHGDVHPGNLLVDTHGNVKILDFGLARMLNDPAAETRRGGAPEYFDPDHAAAARAGASPPPATASSEQYALAALCYRIATNRDYLRFLPEADAFYEQIVREPPLPFAENGVIPWPDLENVLRQALSKTASDRFPSVAAMASAVARIDTDRAPVLLSATGTATLADRLIGHINKLVDPNNELFALGPDTGPRATFMNGAAGIAYYLLRQALLTGDPAQLAAADQWAERAVTLSRGPRGIYDEGTGAARNRSTFAAPLALRAAPIASTMPSSTYCSTPQSRWRSSGLIQEMTNTVRP